MVATRAVRLLGAADRKPDLHIPACWSADPPGRHRRVAGQARHAISGDGLGNPALAYFCAPGEVPRQTGAPWPVDAPPPRGAQADGESDSEHWPRVRVWATEQPAGDPID